MSNEPNGQHERTPLGYLSEALRANEKLAAALRAAIAELAPTHAQVQNKTKIVRAFFTRRK